MDMKKHWEKYNIPKIKTVRQLKVSKRHINDSHGFVYSAWYLVMIIITFGSLRAIFAGSILRAIIGGAILSAIVSAIFVPILKNIKNNGLKYDTNPKLSDSKKKAKEILTSMFSNIPTLQMNKAKKILTKMCEVGNFIGFEKLYPQLSRSMVKSWHDEIIQNKNYPSIAYALLLDNKIFHDYFQQNDVNVATIEALIELGMDLQIFKNDTTFFDNSSEDTKKAIATALKSNDDMRK